MSLSTKYLKNELNTYIYIWCISFSVLVHPASVVLLSAVLSKRQVYHWKSSLLRFIYIDKEREDRYPCSMSHSTFFHIQINQNST